MNAREKHSELLLAAINADAHSDRMNDTAFRNYVKSLLADLDLPTRASLELLKGGRA